MFRVPGAGICRGRSRAMRAVATALAVVSASLLTVTGHSPQVGAQSPSIRFVDSEQLKLTYADGAIKPVVVTIQNGGPAGDLKLTALLSSGGKPAADGIVQVAADPKEIQAGAVRSFALSFTPSAAFPKQRASLAGDLIVENVAAGVTPGSRAMKLTVQGESALDPIATFLSHPAALVLAPTLLALGGAGARFLMNKNHQQKKLGALLGSATWKFTESWASTLTAVGAILGSVLVTSLLPESPRFFSKAEYVALNVLLLATITAAGFLFNTRRTIRLVKGSDNKETPYYFGTIFWFLVSSATVLAAVIAQLIILFVFLVELNGQGTLNAWMTTIFLVLVFILALLAVMYWWRTSDDTLRYYILKPDQVKMTRNPNEQPPEKWSAQAPSTIVPIGIDAQPSALQANVPEATTPTLAPPPPASWSLP